MGWPVSFTAIRNEFQYARGPTKKFVSTFGPMQQELTAQVV